MSCHLFTDPDTLHELHQFAAHIGLSRSWFQASKFPHYDLTAGKRIHALAEGAQELDRQGTVLRIRAWRAESRKM